MASDFDKKITSILGSPSKAMEDASGILSKLWRTILHNRNISGGTWSRLMTEYLNDPQNKVPHEGKKRSSDRNNLNKELARSDMTWNVFYKGLKLLGVVKFRIDITLVWRGNSKPTVHSLVKEISKTTTTTTNNGESKDVTSNQE